MRCQWSVSILTWTDFLFTYFLLLLCALIWSNIFQLLEKTKLSFTFKTLLILHLHIGQFFHHLHKANSFSFSRACLKTSIHQRSLPGPLDEGICSYGIMQSFLTLHCKCVSRTWAPAPLAPQARGSVYLVTCSFSGGQHTATLKEYLLNKWLGKEMDVNHQREGHTQVKAPGKKVHRLRRESLLCGQEKGPHFLVVTTVSGGQGLYLTASLSSASSWQEGWISVPTCPQKGPEQSLSDRDRHPWSSAWAKMRGE